MKKEKKKFDIWEFYKNFWYLIKSYKKDFYFLIFLIFLISIFSLIDPYIIKIVIDSLVEFNPDDLSKILFLLIILFLINRIAANFIYYFDKRAVKFMINMEAKLQIRAQEKMLDLSLAYHEKENTGNKIIKIQKGVDRLVQLLNDIFWNIMPTFFRTIITATILFVVDYRFGLIFLITVPAFLIITFKGNKEVSPQRKKRHDGYEKASGIMAQSIININTVKSFTQEKREKEIFSNTVNVIRDNSFREFFTMFRYGFYRGLIVDVGLIIIICFGIFLMLQNKISIGSLVFVITISQNAMQSLWSISRIYDKVMESNEALKRINKLFNEESEIKNNKNAFQARKIKGDIEFRNVSFAYKNSFNRALHSVNLKIKPAETVALIGPSGGGKTTVARMIYRHYDPEKGQVLIDGVDIRDYDLHSFRSHIAIVPQDVEIFSSSVKENIAYAKPDTDRKKIEEAAKIANAHNFISKLSNGYETEVGERGIKLSGGQRQRLGIARAILADPKILIFDEATSNLDSHSEKLIQDSLEKICKNRTVIIIAHRLSTIKKVDKIIALKNGKVVEQGSHAELLKLNKGLYAELLNLQNLY